MVNRICQASGTHASEEDSGAERPVDRAANAVKRQLRQARLPVAANVPQDRPFHNFRPMEFPSRHLVMPGKVSKTIFLSRLGRRIS
jgi:hypothetical protein